MRKLILQVYYDAETDRTTVLYEHGYHDHLPLTKLDFLKDAIRQIKATYLAVHKKAF